MEKDVKKKSVKKNEKVKSEEKKNTKKDIKNEEVKLEKKSFFKKILGGLKKFFNNPIPLFIVFIAIIAGLLLFIQKNTTSSKIYVGSIQNNDLQIGSIHYFTNGDMNYFYASPALYEGEYKTKKVYNYQVGYFVVTPSKEYVSFVTRSDKLNKAVDVKTLVDEMSAWDFGEAKIAEYFFKPEVVNNLDKIHFVFRGSTNKDSDKADVVIDVPVELSKITKN